MDTCEKCGGKLKMYYMKFCPKCDKPEGKVVTQYNLFRCMYYAEAHGYPGLKDTLWPMLCDSYNISNDIIIKIYCPTKEDIEEESGKYKTYAELLAAVFEKNGIKEESALFEISW